MHFIFENESLENDGQNLPKPSTPENLTEFEIKVKTLQKEIVSFKKNINISRNKLDSKRIEATTKILDVLNPILSEYSAKNSISLIIQKKNIVIGKSDLDITSQILKLVNAKIKSVKLN